jgi:gliding motility-associated-like protein
VKVNDCPIPLIDIPTAITDNDDGANETFFVDKLRFYPENKIRIYNRWGTMVYERIGYNNEWEAIVDGEELPIGTYYYVLDLNDKENTSYQGYVTVVRP